MPINAARNYAQIVRGWVNTLPILKRSIDLTEPKRIAGELASHLREIPEAVAGDEIDALANLDPSALNSIIKQVPPRLLLDIQRDTLRRVRQLGTRQTVELLILEGEGSEDNTRRTHTHLHEGGDLAPIQYILMRTPPIEPKPRTTFFPALTSRSSTITTLTDIGYFKKRSAKKLDPLLEIPSPAVSITTYAFTPFHHIPLQSGSRLAFGPLQAGFVQSADLIAKPLDEFFHGASPVDILIIGGTEVLKPAEENWARYFDLVQASQLQPLFVFVPDEHRKITQMPSFTMISLGLDLAVYAHVVFDPYTQILDLFLHRTETGGLISTHHVGLDKERRLQQLLGNREAITVLRQTIVDYIRVFPPEIALSQAIDDVWATLPFAAGFILDREMHPYHDMSVVQSSLRDLRRGLKEVETRFNEGGDIERTFERWVRRWNPESASPRQRQMGSVPPDRSAIEQEIRTTVLPQLLRSHADSRINRCFYEAVSLIGLIESIPYAKMMGSVMIREIKEEWDNRWSRVPPNQIRTMTYCFVTLMNAWMQDP